ncbi:MAG: hypothetical protein JXO51_04000 [Candidatus Aminicenantes bacterium]|nr:hypothetical protein [Candidatus Aminicenantes bacterium]
MEMTLAVLNELKKKELITEYAIGGGMGAVFYIEPFLTYDLDIFIIVKNGEGLDPLARIYEYLKRSGYKPKDEQVIIEGVPVQFLPAWNDLLKEAVHGARSLMYKGISTRVMAVEHLLAIMLDAGRAKDRERFLKVLAEAELDRGKMKRIIKHHGLQEKFASWKKHLDE